MTASRRVHEGVWRNGSASDSRSEGWEFESLCPHFDQPLFDGRAVDVSSTDSQGEGGLPSTHPDCRRQRRRWEVSLCDIVLGGCGSRILAKRLHGGPLLLTRCSTNLSGALDVQRTRR